MQRAFAKKGRKSKGSNSDQDSEPEMVEEVEPVVEEEVEIPVEEKSAQFMKDADTNHDGVIDKAERDRAFSSSAQEPDKENPAAELFNAFSVGDIPKVQTTDDHKPPFAEDTIEGRYASVLFTSASEQEALYTIYEDMTYIEGLYKNSESFKLFTQNAGVGGREIRLFNEALSSLGDFHPLTIKFLEILAENKRLVFISGISARYQKLYRLLNKEEKITIISAETLSTSEEGEVLAALKANPQNSGKEFQLEFTVDPLIKGGLQMYTETEFMDMSLSSRIDKLRSEVTKLIE